MAELVPLSAITLDVELQPRDEIDGRLIDEYADLLGEGVVFPPVMAFRNGDEKLYLADGWHRYYAHAKAKRETIAVEVREGDRLDAIRASLQANATHGRQRTADTLLRAYSIAVNHELVDPADTKKLIDLLCCSRQSALKLTKTARDARKKALTSIALALAARGCTQEEIAKQLGVKQRTLSDWLSENAPSAESLDTDPLPDAAVLDRVAQAIKDEAKGELREEVEKQLVNEVAKMRRDFNRDLREFKEKAQEAYDKQTMKLRDEIERLHKQLQEHAKAAEPDTSEAPNLTEQVDDLALQAAAQAIERGGDEPDEAVEIWNRDKEQRDIWFEVIEVLEAIERLDPQRLRNNPFAPFERKVRDRLQPAAMSLLSVLSLVQERL